MVTNEKELKKGTKINIYTKKNRNHPENNKEHKKEKKNDFSAIFPFLTLPYTV